MNELKLRKYCLVVLLPFEEEGNLKSKEVRSNLVQTIKDDLLQLANTPPKYVLTKANFLASFTSAFEPKEIKNIMDDVVDRIYFLFETEDNNFASNLPSNISEHLFQLIDNESKVEANSNSNTSTGFTESSVMNVSKLNTKERVEMLNDLFDKGLENLNEEEKKLLDLLSKEGK